MGKNILSTFLLATLLIVLTSSLTLKQDTSSSLEYHRGYQNVAHFLSAHFAEIPQSVFNDLLKYVQDDKEITQNIKEEKRLSTQSAQKIKSFFLNNKQFQSFAFNILVEKVKDPKCLDGMKDQTKSKLLKIILDQWDFTGIFLTQKHQENLDKTQVKKIVEQLRSDKEINPFLEKCFSK